MRAALALVTLALLSGCLGPVPEGPAPPAAPPQPQAYPFGMRGCQAVIAAVQVPQAAVAPHLPEGWRSLSLQELGLPGAPNPREDGNLGLEMFVCEQVDGLARPVAGGVYGSVWSAVEPPPEFRRDVTYHFVKWDTAVADPDLRARLRAAGLPATSAQASYDTFQVLPAGASRFVGAIAFEEGWSVSFDGAAATPFPPTGTGLEYTPIPGGFAAWFARFVWDPLAIGPVTVQVQGASLASEVLGDGPRQGAAFAGVVRFEDANVTVPG